jgi:tripartite-type tricarboxylate transporter receptor subunit TctC
MKQKMLIAACLIALACVGLPASALAQFYKGKTITMIINYPAGGPTDIEGRIVAQHLPAHIPGNPTIVIKNVGGAGGIIGSNQLGEAVANGDTIGMFTLDMVAQLVGNTAIRTPYSDFVLIAGVESPLVVYMRKDTPPGVNVAADLMKTGGFKALSLNAQNSNTVNQLLALDLLGIKYQAIPAYRGLKEVETAILQDIGQLANSSLSGWRGSVEPTMGHLVIPLWQLSPRKNGTYPRSRALPDMPTFEEFYATVHPGKKLAGNSTYEAMRAAIDPLLAMFRVVMMPPKTSGEAVTVMRTAFVELWKNPQFMADYSKIVKTEPILVSGSEGQEALAELGRVRREVKEFLIDYTTRITAK